MKRRRVLQLLASGALGVAGCSSGGPTPTPDAPPTATPTPEATESPTPSPTPTPPLDPVIVTGTPRLRTVGYQSYSGSVAELPVTNEGGVPTDRLELSVEWLNSIGGTVGTSTGYIATLGPGQTWVARVEASTVTGDRGDIERFEASVGDVGEASSLAPSGVSLASKALRTGGSGVFVRAEVRNERDDTLDYLEVVGHVHDSDDAIIGTGEKKLSSIPPGDSVTVELRTRTHGRDAAVEDVSVVLAERNLGS